MYCYIVTRRDLGFQYASVMAAHAAWEAGKAFSRPDQEHPYFSIVSVRDERRLLHDLHKLQQLGFQTVEWREPDQNNELTAFAVAPTSDRRPFRNFQLLTPAICEKKEVANVAD